MRHVAGSVRPGAQVVAVEGRWAANALAFRNADGREVIVVQNPLLESQKIVAQLTGIVANVTLPPRSFVTISTT
jgi:glucosylceramidase